MDLRTLLPIIVTVLVGLVVLRMVIGAIRVSAKLMTWAVLGAAMFGLAYLWYQDQNPADRPDLPMLSIPAQHLPAP